MFRNIHIANLGKLAPERVLDADVCIIGAGPAGFTLATELANTPLSVLVLESGGRGRETGFAAGLNEIESIGEQRVMDQRKVRNRVLGGSSLTWSGRCTPLDAIDYLARPWVPFSGWPIAQSELEPLLRRASAYLGLLPLDYDDSLLKHAGQPMPPPDDDALRSVYWQFSRSSAINDDYVRFGPRFRRLKAPNIRLLTQATATELLSSASGRQVTEIRVVAPDRTPYRVRSRYIVLCGGGIENARLLLASNRRDPAGIGNTHDLVGRFLMDHPRATLGTFDPASHAPIQKDFGLYRHPSGAMLQRGLSLSPDTQKSEQLLNCAAWMTQHVAQDDAWRALRMIGRRNGSDRLALSRVVIRYQDQILRGLWNKLVRGRSLPRRMGRLDLDAMIEQAPNPHSRITLSGRTDALGMPLACVDWKIGLMERQTAIHLGHAVNEALSRSGRPQARLVDWVRDRRPEDAVFEDPAHPIGATRMAHHPTCGVVDRQCRVYGVDNLFVSGSSVFPTGGHANPTLMIVTMALQLADLLRKEAASR
ncbi:MAG TPA: GMC family oxidoreductase [Acidobacteriaceae bacterium]